MGEETDRQTDRQTDGQTNRQTERERQTDRYLMAVKTCLRTGYIAFASLLFVYYLPLLVCGNSSKVLLLVVPSSVLLV